MIKHKFTFKEMEKMIKGESLERIIGGVSIIFSIKYDYNMKSSVTPNIKIKKED